MRKIVIFLFIAYSLLACTTYQWRHSDNNKNNPEMFQRDASVCMQYADSSPYARDSSTGIFWKTSYFTMNSACRI